MTEIVIVNKSSFLRNLSRTAGFVLAVVLPVTVGIAADSPAMQWVGFVFGVIFMFGFASALKKTNTVHSFAEARALLDQMERNQ